MTVPMRLSGTIFVSGTRTLYVGPIVATAEHAHHAAQIIVAPEELDLADGGGGHRRVSAAVIPPRVTHRHGASAHGALLFLDGDDPISRALAREAAPRCEAWGRTALGRAIPREPSLDEAGALITSIVAALELPCPPAPRHPAARRMCASLDGADHVDLARLSHQAGLSARQMRYAFARDIGLPMRAYLRWKRLRLAISAVEEGASLSAAAAAAGFADSAHLSRVFREQFGMTPTQALGSIRWRTLD